MISPLAPLPFVVHCCYMSSSVGKCVNFSSILTYARGDRLFVWSDDWGMGCGGDGTTTAAKGGYGLKKQMAIKSNAATAVIENFIFVTPLYTSGGRGLDLIRESGQSFFNSTVRTFILIVPN